jgi:hypothetical protein
VARGDGPKGRVPKSSPRTPKALPPASSQQQTPLFCFQHADRSTREAWRFEPHPEDAAALFEFMCNIGKSTWAEIERQQTGTIKRHRKHHSQPISSICAGAQKDIKRLGLGETFGDEIFRFRLSGEQRLWGFRVDRTFYVIWWDPEHKVYETEND